MITVLKAGPLTTVQDLGRPGFAHLGVPRSGALDQPALRRANASVGNDPAAAGLETTLMGCRLRFESAATIAVAGASCTVKIDGEPIPAHGSPLPGPVDGALDHANSALPTRAAIGVRGPSAAPPGLTSSSNAVGAEPGRAHSASSPGDVLGPIAVPAGAVVEIGRAVAGVRTYLAVAGGIDVEPVLGSRSTDTLSGLGPCRLVDGQTLQIGPPPGESDKSGGRPGGAAGTAAGAEIVLGVWRGPRDDWVAVAGLFAEAYRVSPVSNRVACRLAGTALGRARAGELPPEGLVLGAIQVPPDGQPLIFLADHPTTGGYPVIGVVDDVTPLAQARPGTSVRFRELH